MRRKGLGKGLGKGYKNLLSVYDSHIHSLSAKGVKTYTLNMMGLAEIRVINREKTATAKAEGTTPFLIKSQEQIDNMPPFPFPHIGDYVPEGYKEMGTYFVDSSGFGSSGELALTINEFKRKMKIGHSYAIIEAGQFQVYVTEFRKVGK